jgi:hypothetical protein
LAILARFGLSEFFGGIKDWFKDCGGLLMLKFLRKFGDFFSRYEFLVRNLCKFDVRFGT